MNNPLVSIVTTYYNSVKLGNFVHESMKYLLNQTYQNIEFICVNDGSQDETLLHLNEYAAKDNRIKIISKENQKYAQFSKGAGQKAATGDYIMLFDHDDKLSPDAIEKAVKTFEEHPDLGIVTMLVEVKYTNGKIRNISNLDTLINSTQDFEFRSITGKEAIFKTVGKYDVHIRGLFRREVFNTHFFSDEEPLLNGDEIVERLIFEKANRIGSCAGVYEHFIYDNSSAKSYSLKKIDMVRTDVKLRKIFKEKNIYHQRAQILELTAYKNITNALKIYHHFSSGLNDDEKLFYKNRMKQGFQHMNKSLLLNNFSGLAKIYNQVLVLNYKLLFFYYKFKS